MPGITYCIANARNVLTTAFDGISGLLKAHTGVFLTKSNKIYKLRLDGNVFICYYENDNAISQHTLKTSELVRIIK
jgi:hypothetical protein